MDKNMKLLNFELFAAVFLFAAVHLCAQGAFAAEKVKVYPPAVAASEAAAEGETEKTESPCEADADCDGIPDEEETRIGTDPNVCDTDGDGLSDGVEVGSIQPDELNGCHGLQAVGTNYKKPHDMDPKNPDSDGDGLDDGIEDANGNGWVDFEETDPTIEDTDSDGVSDYVEMTGDFDGDGIADFDFSLIRAGQKCTPPGSVSDLDCDGIPNARDNDSDNDGCADNFEDGFVDANANGIPDLYDDQERSACPEVPSGGGGGGGGKKAAPAEEGEKAPSSYSPFSADGTDGGACTFVPSKSGHSSRDAATPIFFLIFIAIAVLVLSRRGQSPA